MVISQDKDIYADDDGVLFNNLGIRNPEELEKSAGRHSRLVGDAILSLPLLKIRAWDPGFYRQLHAALLGGVYPWAGEYRRMDVGIAFDNVAYEPWRNIPEKVEDVFAYIRENACFRHESIGKRIIDLSLVFGTLKNIQPFRDGNTRTALLFTQLVARQCGMAVDYSIIDKGEFAVAQLDARDGNPTPLALCFTRMTFPLAEARHIHAPVVIADGRDHDILAQIASFEKGRSRKAGIER